MAHATPNTACRDRQRSPATLSNPEDALAQLVQFWIEQGWSLGAIAMALRNVAGGLDLMRRINGALQ